MAVESDEVESVERASLTESSKATSEAATGERCTEKSDNAHAESVAKASDVKRQRGRPKKTADGPKKAVVMTKPTAAATTKPAAGDAVKKGRGRPKKTSVEKMTDKVNYSSQSEDDEPLSVTKPLAAGEHKRGRPPLDKMASGSASPTAAAKPMVSSFSQQSSDAAAPSGRKSRGRPPKQPNAAVTDKSTTDVVAAKRKRGRPPANKDGKAQPAASN